MQFIILKFGKIHTMLKKIGIQLSLSLRNNEVKCDHSLVRVILILASKINIVVEQLANNPMLKIFRIAKSFTRKSVFQLNVVVPCLLQTCCQINSYVSTIIIYYFEVWQDSYNVKKLGIQLSLSIEIGEIKCGRITWGNQLRGILLLANVVAKQ